MNKKTMIISFFELMQSFEYLPSEIKLPLITWHRMVFIQLNFADCTVSGIDIKVGASVKLK